MSEQTKKILIAVAILASAVVFGFLLWYFFFRVPPVPVTPPPPPPPIGGLPPGQPGQPPVVTPGAPGVLPTVPSLPSFPGGVAAQPVLVTSTPAESPSATESGASYYDPTTGKFSRIDAQGNIIAMSDRTFFGVENVDWAPQSDKAILEFPNGDNVLMNFATNTQVTLPQHWEDFTFSPDGEKIAGKSIGVDVESRWLFTANADGSGSQAIESLGENASKVQVSWSPNNQVVAFARTGQPRDGASQEIIPLGMHDENFKALVVPGFGFEPKWSPDGNNLLFSVYNQDSGWRPTLYLASGGGDTMGDNRQFLRVQTWADKCTFQNSTTVFCGIPTNLPEGAGLERSLADTTPDSIYRIDLTTGTQTLIVPPGSESVKDITTTADGRFLFYTDLTTGRLHRIAL